MTSLFGNFFNTIINPHRLHMERITSLTMGQKRGAYVIEKTLPPDAADTDRMREYYFRSRKDNRGIGTLQQNSATDAVDESSLYKFPQVKTPLGGLRDVTYSSVVYAWRYAVLQTFGKLFMEDADHLEACRKGIHWGWDQNAHIRFSQLLNPFKLFVEFPAALLNQSIRYYTSWGPQWLGVPIRFVVWPLAELAYGSVCVFTSPLSTVVAPLRQKWVNSDRTMLDGPQKVMVDRIELDRGHDYAAIGKPAVIGIVAIAAFFIAAVTVGGPFLTVAGVQTLVTWFNLASAIISQTLSISLPLAKLGFGVFALGAGVRVLTELVSNGKSQLLDIVQVFSGGKVSPAAEYAEVAEQKHFSSSVLSALMHNTHPHAESIDLDEDIRFTTRYNLATFFFCAPAFGGMSESSRPYVDPFTSKETSPSADSGVPTNSFLDPNL